MGPRLQGNTGDGFAPEPAGIPESRREGHLARSQVTDDLSDPKSTSAGD